MSGLSFWEGLSEGLGFKTGLTLSQAELAALLASDKRFAHLADLPADEEHGCRFESIEYEELFQFLLFRLGRVERETTPFPVIDLHHKYKRDRAHSDMAMGVAALFVEHGDRMLEEHKGGPLLDPTPFIEAVFRKYGKPGAEIALELISAINMKVIASPWSLAREITWQNEIELRALFESEGIQAPQGSFLDQRYIDFLHRNFERIDEIHWRKFEQLTAEFFQREGYSVDLGPGRNDGGVDLRLWPRAADVPGQPATVLVQCKRQKSPIGRVVLKALYADVAFEGAKSGLIVTTSRLSPGARDDRHARGYPIDEADRATVKEWIEKLRKPGAGYVA